jgi:uncharacterized protein (TIGR02246 family)
MLLSFGRSTEAADSAADEALCQRLWTQYLDVVKGVQPEKVAAWYTKDAVITMPDAAELRGRDAIHAYLVKAYRDLKIFDLTFRLEHFEVAGAHVYTFGTVTEVIQKGVAPQTKLQARCAAVWERQPDNTWQIAHFLVNFLTL